MIWLYRDYNKCSVWLCILLFEKFSIFQNFVIVYGQFEINEVGCILLYQQEIERLWGFMDKNLCFALSTRNWRIMKIYP